MFSSVLTATDAYPTGTGGRDKITSEVYWFLVIGSPLYEHEQCHDPYFIPQINIFEFIEEFLAFKAR
jgi:hypothetical protein